VDKLYRSLSGIKVEPDGILQASKEAVLNRTKSGPPPLPTILSRRDVRDQFVLTLTYTSNTIEGSTLTEHETEAVLFHNATPPNRTVTEVLEAKNHQTALLHVFDHLAADRPIDEALILQLHAILMNGILPDAGRYRTHAVRIVGSNVPTANYLSVPARTSELMGSVASGGRGGSDIIRHVAETHARFEQIHPFSDGNGRIGRLLMHAMLLRAGLPPAVIHPRGRRRYYTVLRQAQVEHDPEPLEAFLCDALIAGQRILLPA
jgi:Fic family protein